LKIISDSKGVMQISADLATITESSIIKKKSITHGINRTPAAPDPTPPHQHFSTSPPYYIHLITSKHHRHLTTTPTTHHHLSTSNHQNHTIKTHLQTTQTLQMIHADTPHPPEKSLRHRHNHR
jgi:hypothetical protein